MPQNIKSSVIPVTDTLSLKQSTVLDLDVVSNYVTEHSVLSLFLLLLFSGETVLGMDLNRLDVSA